MSYLGDRLITTAGNSRKKLRKALPLIVFTIYIGYGALAVVDGTLANMHQPGGASVTATSVLSPLSIAGDTATANTAPVQAWVDWTSSGVFRQAQVGEHPGEHKPSAPLLLLIYTVIDVLLIAIPVALLLFAGISSAKRRLALVTVSGDGETPPAPENDPLTWPLELAAVLTVVSLAADCAEDLALLAAVTFNRGISGWIHVAGALSLVKLICWGLAALGCVAGIAGARHRHPWAPGWRQRYDLLALRVHLALAALFLGFLALSGDLGRQLDDAFLLLFDDCVLLLVTLAVAGLASGALWATALLSLSAYAEPPDKPPHAKVVNGVIFGVGIAMAIIGGFAVGNDWPIGQLLLVPGILIALVALFSFQPVNDTESPQEPDSTSPQGLYFTRNSVHATRGSRVASLIAATPLGVLIGLAVRNLVRLVTISDWWAVAEVAALCTGLAIIAMAVVGYSPPLPRTNRSWVAISALAVLAINFFVVLGWSPQATGTKLGPWGVMFALALALALGSTALLLAGDALYPGKLLAACRLHRLPVITIVAICFVATSAIDDQSVYHSTRLLAPANGQLPSPWTVEQALGKWLPQQGQPAAVPMVFVAAAGGGIRAAYWTTIVLNCLTASKPAYQPASDQVDATLCNNPKMPAESVFLASGISGGSLGLAVSKAIENPNLRAQALRSDFLGPSMAGLAFRDLPNAFLRIGIHGEDRAAALERAWEQATRDVGGNLEAGFMDKAHNGAGPAFPLLALNGTSVTDGCRVTVSALQLADPNEPGPATSSRDCLALDHIVSPFDGAQTQLQTLAGTKDAFANTCGASGGDKSGQDLRLSTAALLSARFPYVSPTGTLTSCQNTADRTFALDGGLIDSSGAGPLALIWPEVANWLAAQDVCIEPKLILIDNSYLPNTAAQAAKRPPELTAPSDGIGAVYNSRSSQARQAAALAFQRFFPNKKCPGADSSTGKSGWALPDVVDFYPVEQPGIEAPLGWTLASRSQRSLDHQLGNTYNRCSAAIVAQWFNGDKEKPAICNEN